MKTVILGVSSMPVDAVQAKPRADQQQNLQRLGPNVRQQPDHGLGGAGPRLLHRPMVINIRGESYRLREKKQAGQLLMSARPGGDP